MSATTPRTYDLTLRIDARKLSLIIDTLAGAATIISLAATPNGQDDTPQPRARHSRHHFQPRGSDVRPTGKMILQRLIATGRQFTHREASDAFVAAGLASNSASPIISSALRAGILQCIEPQVYRGVGPKQQP